MKILTFVLIGFFLLSIASASQVESFSLPAKTMQSFVFNLNTGDTVTGSISVTGGNDDVYFTVKDPSGNEMISKRMVQKGTLFSFTSTQSGAHTMVLDNSFSFLTGKTVQVTYDVIPASHGNQGSGICSSAFILVGLFGAGLGVYWTRKQKRV